MMSYQSDSLAEPEGEDTRDNPGRIVAPRDDDTQRNFLGTHIDG